MEMCFIPPETKVYVFVKIYWHSAWSEKNQKTNASIRTATLPEHLSSPPVFSGVRVTRSLVLYVCFVDRCLSFCTFSFGHCVVCSSSIYGF